MDECRPKAVMLENVRGFLDAVFTDYRPPGTSPTRNEFTEAQKNACSIDAMMNGGECEACQ